MLLSTWGSTYLFKYLLPIFLGKFSEVEMKNQLEILFNSFRSHHTVFHSSCTFYIPINSAQRGPIPPHPHQHLLLHVPPYPALFSPKHLTPVIVQYLLIYAGCHQLGFKLIGNRTFTVCVPAPTTHAQESYWMKKHVDHNKLNLY